jgi:hypothetical protein
VSAQGKGEGLPFEVGVNLGVFVGVSKIGLPLRSLQLVVEFSKKMEQSLSMAQPPKPQEHQDEWETGTREGYEDLGSFRPPRVPTKQPGSSILRVIGSSCIVAGIFWAVYVVTRGGDVIVALQQNRGPVFLIALGVVVSLLGKYLHL